MLYIKKSPTADTRTCDVSKVTKEQLEESTRMHIRDVKMGMKFLSDMLIDNSTYHDWTKLENIDEFYADFKTGFKATGWWDMHKRVERHHLATQSGIRDDVNLLDVLEYIVDGVMAGLGRSSEYRKERIPKDLLGKAFDNTIKLMLDNVRVLNDKIPENDLTEYKVWDGKQEMTDYYRADWPRSQKYMDEPWFKDEAFLDNSDTKNFPMTFYIPMERLKEFIDKSFGKINRGENNDKR